MNFILAAIGVFFLFTNFVYGVGALFGSPIPHREDLKKGKWRKLAIGSILGMLWISPGIIFCETLRGIGWVLCKILTYRPFDEKEEQIR